MKNLYSRFLGTITLVLNLLISLHTYADGSKDLYPSGVKGNRAYLMSYSDVTSGSIPFSSLGTHYVYANKNEIITLASSAWTGDATIKLFDINGNEVTTLNRSNNAGRISTRLEELAGPKLSVSDATTNRYLPIYYTVPNDGVYRVEFWSKTIDKTSSNSGLVNSLANTDFITWNSNTSTSTTPFIGAWDISVIKSGSFVHGRVYANLLNMRIEPSYDTNYGFYGKMYVLTKDGYTYLVDNNGNNGILFSFFVNNNGFVKGNGGIASNPVDYTPLYKSLTQIDAAVANKQIWDPTAADNEHNITHKMFYTLPSQDLPKNVMVKGAVPGGETWLKNDIIVPTVMNPQIIGADSTVGQVSSKGGYIQFETGSQGSYVIEIISTGTPSFPTRSLYGTAVTGLNKLFWDGKDGAGNTLPVGLTPAKVTVELQGAEVHFPYFDMENNINGIKLQLLNHEKLPDVIEVESDIVYWNDIDLVNPERGNPSNPKNNSHLPTSLGGISSTGSNSTGTNANGHKWGGSATSKTLGDEKSMDTWTFIKGEKKTVDGSVAVKKADLKISSITADKTPVHIGNEVTYTIKVKNDGPSDVLGAPFSFILPQGFEKIGTPTFTGAGCGSESIALTYDATTNKYISSLNLPNGCEITYTIKTIITESSTQGSKIATATILRPNDVTDPDATNQSDPNDPTNYVPPTDPFYECEHNGLSVPCNNIQTNTVSLIRSSDLQIEKTVSESIPEVGEVVTFTLKVTNNGPHSAANIVVTDIVPSGYTIKNINNGGINTDGTIKWTIASLAKDGYTSVSFTATVLASGNYVNTASVDGDGEDPDPTNNSDTATANPCQEQTIFFEDFGTSDKSVNFGRTTSPYMPDGSFTFGDPYPSTNDYYTYAIDNNHYAVVAPGYIELGHKPNNYYFWTPAYNESNTVQDHSSGTEYGAVMVINAGSTLNAFYKRQQLLQVGAHYRASLWMYLVKGPSQIAIDIRHPKTGEVLATVKSDEYQDWNPAVKNKWTYLELYFTVPVPDDEENCKVDNVVLSYRNNKSENQGNDYYIDDIRLEKVCSVPDGTIIIRCPDPNYKNLWYGTTDNDWAKEINWTAEVVPTSGEDIEFATNINNGANGAAIRDLHLDTDRIIGDLINNSDMNLVVTTENQLTINGTVQDSNPDKGTIIVKTSTDKPTGTLVFSNPLANSTVNSTVEFYNKAYECSTCGFYKRQWQYFGIPVNSSIFPSTGVETINQWVESYNGDKWRPAPYTPDTELKAFKGYEMTNSATTLPDKIYSYTGSLNIGDAIVPVTKTSDVNYSGMNLLSNSYTGAIPISTDAITFDSGLLEETVYLFNTGTRDQWRKLNGSTETGISGGQYQAVPFHLAGQGTLPDRILSMHAFMLNALKSGQITLKYDKLSKNELINQLAWRSLKSDNEQLPHIIMDVIGSASADRVWLFENPATSTGFDNGWDGYKLLQEKLIQVYVSGEDRNIYQIATVPKIAGTTFGLKIENDQSYKLNISVTSDIESRNLLLRDLSTGYTYPIINNAEYTINRISNSANTGFEVISGNSISNNNEDSPLINIIANNRMVSVSNLSEVDCIATIYDLTGRMLTYRTVKKYSTEHLTENYLPNGVYIVKAISNDLSVKKTSRVLIK